MMLERICEHIHNFFTDEGDVRRGAWTVEGGRIDLTGIVAQGQYFRVVGSAFNDGVYQYVGGADGATPEMRDETFTGEIWPMRVPRAVLELSGEIEAWQEQYGAAMASPFQAESVIGVYSYTKTGGNTSVNGVAAESDGWKSVFRSRLNPWRKLR